MCSPADVTLYSCCAQAGEELLLDYGKLFWTGREDLMVDDS